MMSEIIVPLTALECVGLELLLFDVHSVLFQVQRQSHRSKD